MFEELKAVIDLPKELWEQDKKLLAIGVVFIYVVIIITLLWILIDFLTPKQVYIPPNISRNVSSTTQGTGGVPGVPGLPF
ncbi:MAG: hypothetical protein OH319_04445 [Candidatus Parvarchaeota archaeon]|nr:hypothetical protein [Candidatus Jingweiarchaeum tengchongense]MCW1297913.1 hypothetical protein [Candidatus Jingweiarchaeum tengchongense]MCW1300654.1 hypothetical protein [Candidatus Jingweiarchaeum tengchongense]MCW1304648.1 hypothetical protein [Candidatus Jingweiarchaeum tengchongense]MCW1306041.1 hypothetical protein [Candidatus Jingweiarchaeum tengchongense]